MWEVERLLTETARDYELPQVLLMENVPQVIGGGAIADFVQWREFLEGLGYKNYTQLMNAKGYAIPQNRSRCFMISILGDYDYIFPPELPLQYRLKDLLERRVDEKYYLSDRTIEMFIEHTAKQQAKGKESETENFIDSCSFNYADFVFIGIREAKMLTKRLRGQIEWHFKNYNADIALYNEKVRDILESGLTPNYGGVGGGGNSISSPTEVKAIKLYELDAERSWATVVRNTFIAFQFEPEHKVMVELYIKGRKLKELLCDGLWETTFYRWRDHWLEYAYKWAKKFGLL